MKFPLTERPRSPNCATCVAGYSKVTKNRCDTVDHATRAMARWKWVLPAKKNFIGLYILRTDVMDAHRDLLKGKGVSLGKGCIRYSKPEKIDFQVVEMMLKATRESTVPICD